MASSVYISQRGNGYAQNTRFNDLPIHSTAVREKWQRHQQTSSWLIPISLPIPGVRTRRLRIMAPNVTRLHHFSVSRFGRRKGTFILCVGLFVMVFTMFAFHQRFVTHEKTWPNTWPTFSDTSTLVYRQEDIQRIWEWEIAAGHYPSSHKLPKQLGLTAMPHNPALPARKSATIPSRFRPPTITNALGTGAKRVYLDVQSRPPYVAYPPRPVPGSAADFDIIMEHCDYMTNQYVRDCLEVLRTGGGLDNGNRLRRGRVDDWQYIYMEDGQPDNVTEPDAMFKPSYALKSQEMDPSAAFSKKRGVDWEPHLRLPPPPKYTPYKDQQAACSEEDNRVFHMFWTGPFTDKPYLALLSFLYTQNLQLHVDERDVDPRVCRPKFWLWVNPGPAASIPNPNAVRDMFDDLKSNPWSSPFLHPRFKDVIQFKIWNTTEQLDGIPELRDEWRVLRDSLFNSGGDIKKVPPPVEAKSGEGTEGADDTASSSAAKAGNDDDDSNRVGSKSASSYDRLSVILSDMARFVLCHRFGGIYLDADTLFLRDWEEMWGWKGAFAYKWSIHDKYNTAVLHLNKGSALGTFLFRTALKNGLDFHPMTISRYTRDAYLDGLLLRLPDALFDSAWLNSEGSQMDRPPQPFFRKFDHFFEPSSDHGAAPQAMGFDGFFKGAYSYHFHNFWWRPFDGVRNWPDLGARFAAGEKAARTAAAEALGFSDESELDMVTNDQRDLSWAMVLKRTFEAYLRGEIPNMYGEWLHW